jgi:hypothetical protein
MLIDDTVPSVLVFPEGSPEPSPVFDLVIKSASFRTSMSRFLKAVICAIISSVTPSFTAFDSHFFPIFE